jgi:hypothetical protein
MTTTTVEERLAEVGRHIDELEARARAGEAEVKPRLQARVVELRRDVESAATAMRAAPGTAEDKLRELDTKVDIGRHRLQSELAEDVREFADAVEAELRDWDASIERLQTKAAGAAGSTREHAEDAIADLRQRRNRVAEHVGSARATTGEAWRAQKARVEGELDELERKAGELTAKLR